MLVRIERLQSQLHVSVPGYWPALVAGLRRLGRHNGAAWVVSADYEGKLLDLLRTDRIHLKWVNGSPEAKGGDDRARGNGKPASVDNGLKTQKSPGLGNVGASFGPGFVLPPYEHQVTALEHTLRCDAFALLMEMGTGKTKVIVDRLRSLPGKWHALIVCPKPLIGMWEAEVKKHVMPGEPIGLYLLTGTLAKRLRTLRCSEPQRISTIVVVNYDVVGTMLKDLSRYRWDVLVADESTKIKNPKAVRTKAMWRLAQQADRRYILTGTPITQSPLDAYAQFRFLDRGILGHESWYSFRAEYARMMAYRPGAPAWQRHAVVGYRNLDRLKERIAPHSYRVLKSDCLDLPPKLEPVQYGVELGRETRKVYDAMREDAVATLEGAGNVAAPLVLTQLMRLQQIASGFVSDEDGAIHRIGKQSDKLSVLLSILEDLPGKAIVWCRFREEIRMIEQALEGRKWQYKGCTPYVSYHGGVPDRERDVSVAAFQGHETVRYFIGQIQAGGLGLTLTAASTVIYMSNTFSLADRLQSEDRAHRIGQTAAVSYLDLVARDTVDQLILDSLRAKKNVADYITGDVASRL